MALQLAVNIQCRKCKVMHVRHTCNTTYFMEDEERRKEMEPVTEEKDLGIFTTSTLLHPDSASNLQPQLKELWQWSKGTLASWMVWIFMSSIDYIWSRLEYCIQAWSPHLIKVQRTASRLELQLKKNRLLFQIEDAGQFSITKGQKNQGRHDWSLSVDISQR